MLASRMRKSAFLYEKQSGLSNFEPNNYYAINVHLKFKCNAENRINNF